MVFLTRFYRMTQIDYDSAEINYIDYNELY